MRQTSSGLIPASSIIVALSRSGCDAARRIIHIIKRPVPKTTYWIRSAALATVVGRARPHTLFPGTAPPSNCKTLVKDSTSSGSHPMWISTIVVAGQALKTTDGLNVSRAHSIIRYSSPTLARGLLNVFHISLPVAVIAKRFWFVLRLR